LDEANIRAAVERAMTGGRIALIFVETPSNPMNSLVDIALVRRISEDIGRKQGFRPIVCCDNRLLGPVFPVAAPAWADLSPFFDEIRRRLRSHGRYCAGLWITL
jgi:methionine-gamma-lyase